MLGDVLKKEDCALCMFCCSFRRQSLWELPRLPLSFMKNHTTGANGEPVRYKIEKTEEGEWAVTDLTGKYKTDDPEEEVACPFLDRKRGCSLGNEDKPFECGAWPLRYMRMPDGEKKVCLTPTCPVMNKADIDVLKELNKEKWEAQMRKYADAHPYITKDYKEGFIAL